MWHGRPSGLLAIFLEEQWEGGLPQRHSRNVRWLVGSHEQNAFPVPGRWLLESLGTGGWEENAARSGDVPSTLDNPEKWAHQVAGSGPAAGLGGEVKQEGKASHAGAWMMARGRPLPLQLACGNHFFLTCGHLAPLGAGPDSWDPPVTMASL